MAELFHDVPSKLPEEESLNPLMEPYEVAALFRVSRKTVVRWGNSGRIPYVLTPGGHHRFRRSDVLDAMLVGGLEK